MVRGGDFGGWKTFAVLGIFQRVDKNMERFGTLLGETVELLNLKWNFQFPLGTKKTFVFLVTIKIAHKKRGNPQKNVDAFNMSIQHPSQNRFSGEIPLPKFPAVLG